MPGPDKSKVKPDLTLDKKTKVNFRQHIHPLPLCSDSHHDASCSGVELSCVKVITGYNPVTHKVSYGAFCSHFLW
jgi:hypothetical protein